MTFPKKDTYDTYGGDLKDWAPAKNFHTIGATDLPAEDFNQCRSSAAGMTHTGFTCYLKFNPYLANPIIEYEAGWNKIKSEEIIIEAIDVGIFTIKFPATVIDNRGKRQSLNMFAATVNVDQEASSNIYQVSIYRQTPLQFEMLSTVNGSPGVEPHTYDAFFF